MTLPVLLPEEIVDKIKNNQIEVSSKYFLKSKSTGELQKSSESSESRSNEEYCVPAMTFRYVCTLLMTIVNCRDFVNLSKI